jgi:16S rRNA (guanine966-N2)-methyltransferase
VTRIVSGQWGGRRLQVPKDPRVRPTAERVREAWLAILGPELAGARVADLFAGSGALGLAAIKANIAALGGEADCTVHRGDAMRFAEGLPVGSFDMVLADPPFTVDYAPRLADLWRNRPFAGILAIEHPPTLILPGADVRRWGDIAVSFFRAP